MCVCVCVCDFPVNTAFDGCREESPPASDSHWELAKISRLDDTQYNFETINDSCSEEEFQMLTYAMLDKLRELRPENRDCNTKISQTITDDNIEKSIPGSPSPPPAVNNTKFSTPADHDSVENSATSVKDNVRTFASSDDSQNEAADDPENYLDKTGKFKISNLRTSNVHNGKVKQHSRVQNTKHGCILCAGDATYGNISKHLRTHRNDPNIAEILEMEKEMQVVSEQEKAELSCAVNYRMNILRQKGDDRHNELVKKTGSGILFVAWRHRSLTGFLYKRFNTCPECFVWLHTT